MENNIFTFVDSYRLQLPITAMGMPAACTYATISHGQHENSKILPTFNSHLLYYKRYIDSIYGIQLPPLSNQLTTWITFKSELNNWGILECVTEEPSTKTTFLDLNVTLNKSTLTTSTLQKSMNLYLYIPPLSLHPSSCFKGLIHGELQHYCIQNNKDEFIDISVSLAVCSKEGLPWKHLPLYYSKLLPTQTLAHQRSLTPWTPPLSSFIGHTILMVSKGKMYTISMTNSSRMLSHSKKCNQQSPVLKTYETSSLKQPPSYHTVQALTKLQSNLCYPKAITARKSTKRQIQPGNLEKTTHLSVPLLLRIRDLLTQKTKPNPFQYLWETNHRPTNPSHIPYTVNVTRNILGSS